MTVQPSTSAIIATGGQRISLGAAFATTTTGANPAYVILSLLDRNEYTAGATGATGTVTGNGHTLSLTSQGSDARGGGLAFAYQAGSGRYFNATYGYLDQLTYTASGSLNDVTDLSLYGTSSSSMANAYASSSYGLMQNSAFIALGTVTVATQPGVSQAVSNATPNAIAAAAQSFVGHAWNENGCWVLASTIAAEAGASLPVASTAIGLPGTANGAWFIAYNGPGGQSGAWQSLVHAGEVIVFQTGSGGGHITTCVAGAGGSAMLIDNITYVNSSGQISNSAHDGSAADIVVAAPHLASQEWAGVPASSVVIYQLDTPTITDLVASVSLRAGVSDPFAQLFSAADPAARAITQFQAYDTNANDRIAVNGTASQASSAAAAVTATSLAALSFVAGSAAGTDTLEVRAYNGTYWGDWQSLAVTITGASTPAPQPTPTPAPRASPPVLVSQTGNLSVIAGQAVSLTLPASTFRDPQGQALTYTAAQSNGQALPSWLHFDAVRDAFSGTAPLTAQTIGLRVTATDTSGLSASETFQMSVTAAPARPTLLAQTANQDFGAARSVSFTVPAGTFGGPSLQFQAVEVSGPNITSWMHFNAATGTFSGAVPTGFSGTAQVQVIALDNAGYATENFSMHFGGGSANGISLHHSNFFGVLHFH